MHEAEAEAEAETDGRAATHGALERVATHAALARVAQNLQGTSSLGHGVSRHVLARSISFASASLLLDAARPNMKRVFLGGEGERLVVSLSFGHVAAPRKPQAESLIEHVVQRVTGGKRRRSNPVEEEVERAAAKVAKAAGDDAKAAEAVARARTALVALLTSVRGAEGESCVESWGLHAGGTDSSPKLTIAVRFSPGAALPLADVRTSLGNCFADGMFRVGGEHEHEHEHSTDAKHLPLTKHGIVAQAAGAASVCLYASV